MKAKQVVRGPFFWIGFVVLGFIVFSQFTSTAGTFKKVDTATVIAAITEGKVESALLVDREQLIQVTLKNGITIEEPSESKPVTSFGKKHNSQPS